LKTGIVPIHPSGHPEPSSVCGSSALSYLYYEIKEGGFIHFTHFNKNVSLKNNSFFIKLDSENLLSSSASLSSLSAQNHRSPSVVVLDVYACEKKVILPSGKENGGEVTVSLLLSSGNVIELHFSVSSSFSSSVSSATISVEDDERGKNSIFFSYYAALEGKSNLFYSWIHFLFLFSLSLSLSLFPRVSPQKEFFTCRFF
jgi:hypothetical protein